MSVKGFFFILVFFLVAIMGFLIYISETVVVKYLYIAEALMLLLMLYLILFYRKIVKPMNTIGSGMELLREQDFSSRLSHVGQQEADRVGKCFQSHDGTTEKRTAALARTESFSRPDD